MSFFDELKRRNVFRVGIAYIVASWVVLQVADLVFEAINAPDWMLQAMMFIVMLGFIVALIIAWAYELTPDGIKREQDVKHGQSVTQETANKLNHITIGLVIAAVAIVVIDRMIPDNASPAAIDQAGTQTSAVDTDQPPAQVAENIENSSPSVAVLPFVNMSSDPEQEFFSDGISEEILNVLTKIPNLKVAARTSSFQFKGQNLDIADIARQLRVNHVLEGSVRKAGSQLRITAQLIEAQTGFHLWSETFDRELEDVFAIQDEIAGAIASELRARLTDDPIQSSTVVDVKAYQLYLKGLGMVATRKGDELFAAFDILKSAIEIEPEYVSAMVTLAKAYVVAPYFTQRETSAQLREKARVWAGKALQLEPENAEALAIMGVIANERDLDSDKALELLRKAALVSPGNLAVNNFLGDLLFRTGAITEAVIYESRAAEIDPLAPVHLADLAFVYLLKGDYDKALDLSGRALKQNPAYFQAHTGQIESYWALGNLPQLELATQALFKSINMPESAQLPYLAKVNLAKSDTQAARKKLLAIYQLAKAGEINPMGVAFDAVMLGDFDIAGEMLIKAYTENIGNWSFPIFVRLPEQAPDSLSWQEFWSLPEPSRLAEIRRANGLNHHYPKFGEGAPK